MKASINDKVGFMYYGQLVTSVINRVHVDGTFTTYHTNLDGDDILLTEDNILFVLSPDEDESDFVTVIPTGLGYDIDEYRSIRVFPTDQPDYFGVVFENKKNVGNERVQLALSIEALTSALALALQLTESRSNETK